jgi:hypothetical protein
MTVWHTFTMGVLPALHDTVPLFGPEENGAPASR